MMRFLSCVALMALVSCVASSDLPVKSRILHERTGHFAKIQSLQKTYELYTKSFDPEWHKDDYRNFRPTERQCYNYLQGLLDNDLEIEKLPDFVKFDACLGVLYEDEPYLYEDRKTLEELKKKTAFRDLYSNTNIERMSPDAQHCIAKLLTDAISGYKQFKAPNDHFVQMFSQFGECTHDFINEEARADPYLEKIYHLVRKESLLAFDATVAEIETLADKMYNDRILKNSEDKVKSVFHFRSSKDRLEKRWPDEVYRLLDITREEDEFLTTRSVHEKIKKFFDSRKFYGEVKSEDPDKATLQLFLDKFLGLLGRKATKALYTRRNFGNLYPDGQKAYDNWRNKLCRPFEYSDKKDANDFGLKMQRLVDITAYKKLFDIDTEYLLSVVKEAGTTATMYLSLSVCNILYSTRGSLTPLIPNGATFSTKRKHNYKVTLSTEAMAKWPVLPYI